MKITFPTEQLEDLCYHIQLHKPLRRQNIACSQLSQQQNFTGIRISANIKQEQIWNTCPGPNKVPWQNGSPITASLEVFPSSKTKPIFLNNVLAQRKKKEILPPKSSLFFPPTLSEFFPLLVFLSSLSQTPRGCLLKTSVVILAGGWQLISFKIIDEEGYTIRKISSQFPTQWMSNSKGIENLFCFQYCSLLLYLEDTTKS